MAFHPLTRISMHDASSIVPYLADSDLKLLVERIEEDVASLLTFRDSAHSDLDEAKTQLRKEIASKVSFSLGH